MAHPEGAGSIARPPRRAGSVPRLVDSAGFRFAVFFAVLFLAGGVAFSGILWWGTAGALDRQTDAAIRADAYGLSERWRDAGRAGVTEAIAERLAEDAENQNLYLLTDARGGRLAGNLAASPGEWDPREMDPELRWLRLPLVRDGIATEARLYRLRLAENEWLIVGRDVEDRLRLRELLAEGLAWSACAAALLALLGALLLRRALEARLRPAAETVAAIAGGGMAHRVPLSGRDDEFDQLGRTLNNMLDRIDALMAGVRGVSDAIAHDLRTPIARARGRLEEALATGEDPAALRAAIEQGIADLDGVTRVFHAVLRITETEAGARRAFAPLDLAPLLEDAAELYAPAAEARGQTLAPEIPANLRLTGDRDLLLQAVANLLDNAVKFTREGGTIRLAAGEDETRLRITVADEGPGLAPEDRARAGERFFRADTARATPGYGLGLSLVRAVARLHGGDLELADARPGAETWRGLAATLDLPKGGE